MTEPTPDAPDTAAQPTDAQTKGSWDDLFAGMNPAEVRQALDHSRKWEQRAKDNKRAADELEAARKAQMTEAERAVLEAEERGRQSAVSTYGQRLARTEFVAEAARRNPGFDASQILDDLNLARYLGDDGEPDSKAIAKAVQRLIPEVASAGTQPPSFDGGARQSAPGGVSMSDLIRQAAGRG